MCLHVYISWFVCSYVWVWTCTYHIVHVEVTGHPQLQVFTFYIVRDRDSCPPPQLHMPRLAGPWTYKDSSVFTSHTPAGALGLQKQTCIQFYMQKQNKTKNLQFYLICVFCGRNNSTISKFYIYSIWGCWNPGFSLQERKIQMWNKGRILKCCVSIG